MPRGPQTFRQRDLCCALKAAKAAGIESFRIEIDPISGRMIMIVTAAVAVDEWTDDLDKWLATHADKA